MSETFRPNLAKLLRVLVAGGIALVGGAATRAEETPNPPAQNPPTQGSEKAPQPDKEAQKKADEQAKADKKKADEKKKAEQSKKDAQPEGGGVKGW
jgi:hypothetical protein